jgi:hypothetical protein
MKRPDRILPCRSGYWDQMERGMAIVLNELSNPPFYSKRAQRKEKWKDRFIDAEVYAITYYNHGKKKKKQMQLFSLWHNHCYTKDEIG